MKHLWKKYIYINSCSCDQFQPIKRAVIVCLLLYFLEYLQWKAPVTDEWMKLCVIIMALCTRWVWPFLPACQHSFFDWALPRFRCFVPFFNLSICTTICDSVCVCLLCQPAVSWWKRDADSAVSRLPPWHPQLQASASSPRSSLPPTGPNLEQFSAAWLQWPLACPWPSAATSLPAHASLLCCLLLISKLKTSHCLSHAFSEASQSETTQTETTA